MSRADSRELNMEGVVSLGGAAAGGVMTGVASDGGEAYWAVGIGAGLAFVVEGAAAINKQDTLTHGGARVFAAIGSAVIEGGKEMLQTHNVGGPWWTYIPAVFKAGVATASSLAVSNNITRPRRQ